MSCEMSYAALFIYMNTLFLNTAGDLLPASAETTRERPLGIRPARHQQDELVEEARLPDGPRLLGRHTRTRACRVFYGRTAADKYVNECRTLS